LEYFWLKEKKRLPAHQELKRKLCKHPETSSRSDAAWNVFINSGKKTTICASKVAMAIRAMSAPRNTKKIQRKVHRSPKAA
jgi:hypothetical protein